MNPYLVHLSAWSSADYIQNKTTPCPIAGGFYWKNGFRRVECTEVRKNGFGQWMAVFRDEENPSSVFTITQDDWIKHSLIFDYG